MTTCRSAVGCREKFDLAGWQPGLAIALTPDETPNYQVLRGVDIGRPLGVPGSLR